MLAAQGEKIMGGPSNSLQLLSTVKVDFCQLQGVSADEKPGAAAVKSPEKTFSRQMFGNLNDGNRHDEFDDAPAISIAEKYRAKSSAAHDIYKQMRGANKQTSQTAAVSNGAAPETEGEIIILRQKARSLAEAANVYAGVKPLSGVDELPGAESMALGAEAEKPQLSAKDGWELMAEKIGSMDKDYIKVYEDIVQRYTDMFGEFSDLMGNITSLLKVSTDKNGVQTFQFDDKALKDVTNLITKYEGSAGILYSAPNGPNPKAEADKWAKQLGLDPDKFVKLVDGKWCVKMDISPLTNIKQSLQDAKGASLSTFEYQSWRSGFDAQGDRLKTALQTLTSKYGSANGNFDTVVKLLSSMITSMSELLRTLCNF